MDPQRLQQPELTPIISTTTKLDLERRIRYREMQVCSQYPQYSTEQCVCKLAGATDLDLCVAGYKQGQEWFKTMPTKPFGTFELCAKEVDRRKESADTSKKSEQQIEQDGEDFGTGCVNGVRLENWTPDRCRSLGFNGHH